jgi:hypothetical protein
LIINRNTKPRSIALMLVITLLESADATQFTFLAIPA